MPSRKYTDETIARICGYIEEGLPHKDAALLGGITEKTFYAWLRDERKSTFRQSVEKAEASFVDAHLANIRTAALGTPAVKDANGKVLVPARAPNWTASAWLLERKRPETYARRSFEKVEATVSALTADGKEGQKDEVADFLRRNPEIAELVFDRITAEGNGKKTTG